MGDSRFLPRCGWSGNTGRSVNSQDEISFYECSSSVNLIVLHFLLNSHSTTVFCRILFKTTFIELWREQNILMLNLIYFKSFLGNLSSKGSFFFFLGFLSQKRLPKPGPAPSPSPWLFILSFHYLITILCLFVCISSSIASLSWKFCPLKKKNDFHWTWTWSNIGASYFKFFFVHLPYGLFWTLNPIARLIYSNIKSIEIYKKKTVYTYILIS